MPLSTAVTPPPALWLLGAPVGLMGTTEAATCPKPSVAGGPRAAATDPLLPQLLGGTQAPSSFPGGLVGAFLPLLCGQSSRNILTFSISLLNYIIAKYTAEHIRHPKHVTRHRIFHEGPRLQCPLKDTV